MKIKVLLLIVFIAIVVAIDLKNSKKINPYDLPSLAIFSKEIHEGGHCSFEVFKKP